MKSVVIFSETASSSSIINKLMCVVVFGYLGYQTVKQFGLNFRDDFTIGSKIGKFSFFK